MARQRRQTEPLETLRGVLTDYGEIEKLLSTGELVGRRWVHTRAVEASVALSTPTDVDILDLHCAMFGEFLAWAGETRREDRGPGGKVPVPWYQVRVALRNFSDDLRMWVAGIASPDAEAIARIIADAHHRFQWIHPFHDTNGRTGRVIDHYLLWVTFGLHGSTFVSSPAIEYFPTSAHEDEYYEGLREADEGDPGRLQSFYIERILSLFNEGLDGEPGGDEA